MPRVQSMYLSPSPGFCFRSTSIHAVSQIIIIATSVFPNIVALILESKQYFSEVKPLFKDSLVIFVAATCRLTEALHLPLL